ncbi:aminoacyl-tRNA hydrolase [Cardiobacteriaceae bacterium TAE3-ERU3]|nr:aminoacyl-tRNA hydrolase [Cardiobacteriaceae bacterium TAE3-ERU3]
MIKLIVGLGNPGDRYAKTRHNAGFWLLDNLNSHEQSLWRQEKKFFAEYSKIFLANQPLHLLKPQTFMNRSGQSVSAIANFYDIEPEQILVVHDELDLPEGTAKLKLGGGHGGHNGLRDIIKALGSKDFYRLRIGIDHPGDRNEVVDYVLKAPGKAGLAQIDNALIDAERILPVLLKDGPEKAMNQLHTCHS